MLEIGKNRGQEDAESCFICFIDLFCNDSMFFISKECSGSSFISIIRLVFIADEGLYIHYVLREYGQRLELSKIDHEGRKRAKLDTDL